MSRNLDDTPLGPARGKDPRGTTSRSELSLESEMLALLPQLRRYSRSLARSDSDGEDLLQDCVEKILVHRSEWRGGSFKSWVYRIMTNLYLNARRSQARRPSTTLDEAEDLAAAATGDPLENRRLMQALDSLPQDARAVLMLVVVEGYAYQEAAEILEVPVGTVMSRLSRARQTLRERLREDNIVPIRRPR